MAAKVTQATDPLGRSKSPGATPTIVKLPLVSSSGLPSTAESRAVAPVPEPLTEDGDGRGPDPVVLRRERAAHQRGTPRVGNSSPVTTPSGNGTARSPNRPTSDQTPL